MTNSMKYTHNQFRDLVVRAEARRFGWRDYYVYDSRKTPPGYPDLTLVNPPNLVFAEIKLPGQKPTPDQQQWLEALAACKTIKVFLWTPNDLQEIMTTLTGVEVK